MGVYYYGVTELKPASVQDMVVDTMGPLQEADEQNSDDMEDEDDGDEMEEELQDSKQPKSIVSISTLASLHILFIKFSFSAVDFLLHGQPSMDASTPQKCTE